MNGVVHSATVTVM